MYRTPFSLLSLYDWSCHYGCYMYALRLHIKIVKSRGYDIYMILSYIALRFRIESSWYIWYIWPVDTKCSKVLYMINSYTCSMFSVVLLLWFISVSINVWYIRLSRQIWILTMIHLNRLKNLVMLAESYSIAPDLYFKRWLPRLFVVYLFPHSQLYSDFVITEDC
jgi:hypothetical protein